MKIPLNKIDIDTSVQVRAVIHQETVETYAEHLEQKGPPMPPIVVFGPDSRGMYFLAEGWHRYFAHKKAGRDGIMATVKPGGWKTALEHALGSNATHGLPRTNKDKRRVVELALKHWSDWNDQMIAQKCSVSDEFVRLTRKEHVPTVGTSEPRVVARKDGTKYTIPPVPTSRPPSSPPASRPPSTPPPDKPKGKPLPVDPYGKTILPHLLPFWERREEVKGMINAVREVRHAIEQARDDRDPLYFGQHNQGQTPMAFQQVIAHLKNAENEIGAAMPHALCPKCNGTGCRACSGIGLITEIMLQRCPK